MQKLKPNRPVERETAVASDCGHSKGRFLVVELHPRYMVIRAKGLKEDFPVDYETIYDLARKVAFQRSRTA